MDNSTLRTLTKLIVANALEDKPCRGLIVAYTEEFQHLCEYEGCDLDKVMPVVKGNEACEQVMAAEFTRAYKAALAHQVDTETCLAVFEYPHDWADFTEVPRALLTAVGRVQALRDACTANHMRRQVMAAS